MDWAYVITTYETISPNIVESGVKYHNLLT